MTVSKETQSLGMPWEQEYGYSQAVKVGDTIYLSGQVSHDDKGNIVGLGDMEARVREQMARLLEVSGCNYVLCAFAWGTFPHAQTLHSLRLFAEEVMPAFSS